MGPNSGNFINAFHQLNAVNQLCIIKHFEECSEWSKSETEALGRELEHLPSELLEKMAIRKDLRSYNPVNRERGIIEYLGYIQNDEGIKRFLQTLKLSLVFSHHFANLNPTDQEIISRYLMKENLNQDEMTILGDALTHMPDNFLSNLREPPETAPATMQQWLSQMVNRCKNIFKEFRHPFPSRGQNQIAPLPPVHDAAYFGGVVNTFRTFLHSPSGEVANKIIHETAKKELQFSPSQMLIPNDKQWAKRVEAIQQSTSLSPEEQKVAEKVKQLLMEYNAVPKFEWVDRLKNLHAIQHFLETQINNEVQKVGVGEKEALEQNPFYKELIGLFDHVENKMNYILEINRREFLVQKEYYPIDYKRDEFADGTPENVLQALKEYQTLTQEQMKMQAGFRDENRNMRVSAADLEALRNQDKKRLQALEKLQEIMGTGNKAFLNKKKEKIPLQELVREKVQYLKYLQERGRAELEYGGVPFSTVQRRHRQELVAMMGMPKGGRPVSQGYWLEKKDPLHRNWSDPVLANSVVSDWKTKSPFSSFLTYLETIEDQPMVLTQTENARIRYFDAKQREEYRLDFQKDGEGDVCILRNGALADTSRERTHFSGEGYAIFVMDADGEVYIGSHVKGERHHSGFLAGENVNAAGEVVIRNGKLVEIKDKSGHYYPTKRHILKLLQVLHDKGIDLSGVKVSLFEKTGSGSVVQSRVGGDELVSSIFDAQELFESHGNCLPVSSASGWTPVHEAVWNGNAQELRKRLEQTDEMVVKSLVSAEDAIGDTPLHLAVRNQTEVMFTDAAKVYQKEASAVQYISSWEKQKECAVLLLGAGADVNAVNKEGETPLYQAIEEGNTNAVLFLMAQEATKIDIPNKAGVNPLQLAASQGSLEIFSALLNDPKATAVLDSPAQVIRLFEAVFENGGMGKTNLLYDLLEKQGKLPEDRNSLLFLYVAKGRNPETLSFLLGKGLDINAKDKQGRTPMHAAVLYYQPRKIEQLVALGGDINMTDIKGQTPLHLAVANGLSAAPQYLGNIRIKTIEMLLDQGANLEVEDADGIKPLQMPIQGGPKNETFETLVEFAKEGFGDLLEAAQRRGLGYTRKKKKVKVLSDTNQQ